MLNKEIRNKYIPFSVAMSVYKSDNPTFFDLALESITDSQTVKPNEIVLVVDGPISNELDSVIAKYIKKYNMFNIIRLKENRGLGNALQIAVENAKFDYIARMDSDDISVFDRFEQEIVFLCKHPEIDVIGGDITEFIDVESNVVGVRKVPESNLEIRKYMKVRCAMNHVSVMYKKSSIQAAGGYQDWFWNEDYYLWIRMWLNGGIFANTGTNLVNVRVGEEMYRRRGGIKYFQSEVKLQKYMLKHKVIGILRYIINVSERLVLQVLMPNRLRGFLFQKLARK